MEILDHSSVAVYHLTHVGAAYGICNSAFKQNGKIKVLEMFPLGRESVVLLAGAKDDLNQLSKKVRNSNLVETMIIEDIDKEVIRGFYGLNDERVDKFLLTIEHGFLGKLFSASNELLKAGFKMVEMNSLRATPWQNFASFTGSDLSLAKKMSGNFKELGFRVTLLDNLSDSFVKHYFN